MAVSVSSFLPWPDLVRSLPSFSDLQQEELELLAETCSVQVFAQGEFIIRKGDPGEWMFMLIEGKVASDDPTTVPSVYPPQQELELKKQEAGKDLAQFDNINQDADESAPDQEVRKDEPLVQQPETTGGDNPGVPKQFGK